MKNLPSTILVITVQWSIYIPRGAKFDILWLNYGPPFTNQYRFLWESVYVIGHPARGPVSTLLFWEPEDIPVMSWCWTTSPTGPKLEQYVCT